MGLISPGGENLLDFLELRQVLSTYDRDLRDSVADVSVHSRETCFPCTASTFKPRIHSHHGGTWDSPVGKPPGKASWESLEGKPQIP